MPNTNTGLDPDIGITNTGLDSDIGITNVGLDTKIGITNVGLDTNIDSDVDVIDFYREDDDIDVDDFYGDDSDDDGAGNDPTSWPVRFVGTAVERALPVVAVVVDRAASDRYARLKRTGCRL